VTKHVFVVFCLLASISLPTTGALAQNMTGDAREVGLGGVDYAARIFSDSSSSQSPGFVIPLGLLQLLNDRQAVRPSSGGFDLPLALEYAAVPAHYVIGRRPSAARARFFADIREAGLSPDLNAYRGFTPAATLQGAGILAPTVGHAFTVHRSARRTHQAYAGAGPYLTVRTRALFDQRLVNMLGASSATYVPSSSLEIGNETSGQLAMQITGGYRGFVTLSDAAQGAQLVLEADYNRLHGFRYEAADINLRLDTDVRGLLAFNSPAGAPLAIDRLTSTHGTGHSVDAAASVLFERWRVSVRADGIGNGITWRGLRRREYEMARLNGGTTRLALMSNVNVADVRVELPVELRLQGAYLDASWGAIAELEHGAQGKTASAGLERRWSAIELRGGARFVNRVVLPSAGVSLRAGRTWVDIGAAMTTANIERNRNITLATSLRFVLGGAGVPSSPVQ
jgi:hypothetical protein